jgi:hypothetical protein
MIRLKHNLAVVEQHIARQAINVDGASDFYTDDIAWKSLHGICSSGEKKLRPKL